MENKLLGGVYMNESFKDINGNVGTIGTKVKIYNPITDKRDIPKVVSAIYKRGRRGTILSFTECNGGEIAKQVEIDE